MLPAPGHKLNLSRSTLKSTEAKYGGVLAHRDGCEMATTVFVRVGRWNSQATQPW